MLNSKTRLNYLPEIKAVLFGRQKPSMVSVNLTSQCNQKCIYCEIGQGVIQRNQEELSFEDLYWIINEMSKEGLKRLSLCGGEPFLFDKIFEVLEYAYENGITCNITSNGMIISTFNETQLKCIKETGARINVSIDSFDSDIQSKTRGVNNAFGNAIKAVGRLREFHIPVTVLSVITRYNYDNLFKSLLSAADCGVEEILYQPVIIASNYPDSIKLTAKDSINIPLEEIPVLMNQLKQILNYEKRHRIKTNAYRLLPWIRQYIEQVHQPNGDPFYPLVLKKFHCREMSAVIDISYNGIIQACGLLLGSESIKDMNSGSLLGKWENSTRKLRVHLENENFPEECGSCCHKFSRNMYSSIFKYPLTNFGALLKVSPLLFQRFLSQGLKL